MTGTITTIVVMIKIIAVVWRIVIKLSWPSYKLLEEIKLRRTTRTLASVVGTRIYFPNENKTKEEEKKQ
jgi:hypothetical protein